MKEPADTAAVAELSKYSHTQAKKVPLRYLFATSIANQGFAEYSTGPATIPIPPLTRHTPAQLPVDNKVSLVSSAAQAVEAAHYCLNKDRKVPMARLRRRKPNGGHSADQ
jgi:hypothetical protein